MTEIEKKAEEWCLENMDCCKSDNMTNEEVPYFTGEERAVAKSAYKDGYESCQKGLLSWREQLVKENAELKKKIRFDEEDYRKTLEHYLSVITDLKKDLGQKVEQIEKMKSDVKDVMNDCNNGDVNYWLQDLLDRWELTE